MDEMIAHSHRVPFEEEHVLVVGEILAQLFHIEPGAVHGDLLAPRLADQSSEEKKAEADMSDRRAGSIETPPKHADPMIEIGQDGEDRGKEQDDQAEDEAGAIAGPRFQVDPEPG